MGFQAGDGRIDFAGQTYGLRLTMGALAEISYRLPLSEGGAASKKGHSGPAALTQALRGLQAGEGRVLLESLMRPCLPPEVAGLNAGRSPVADLSDADVAKAMPVICEVFEHGFTD